MFSQVSVHSHLGGTSIPGSFPGPFLGVTQSQVLSQVFGPRTFSGGTPVPVFSQISSPRSFLTGQNWPGCTSELAGGYPSPGWWVPQSQVGGTPVLAGGYTVSVGVPQDWGTSLSRKRLGYFPVQEGLGYPPGQDRTGVPPQPGQDWGAPQPGE